MPERQVGPYRLDHLLGSGGMGDVYQAYDTIRGRYVALKLLPQAFSHDQEYLKRFQRESFVAARLRDPHVIPIHDFGEIDGQLFIDMRLVDGVDIGVQLATKGRMAPQRAVYMVSQVAEALDAAHADHLVHRDIKPSNILVTSNDFVYVVDFGIARSSDGGQTPLTITGLTIGTLQYMAPERFAGNEVDGRADVYSLACVLHECLTGAPPFGGKELPALIAAQLYSVPPQASTLVEGVPPALDAVIARGMAKDPKDRFATAGLLAAMAREALLTQAPAPSMTELHHSGPAPTWQAAAAVADRPGVAEPPGPAAEPAGDRSVAGVQSATQTSMANRSDQMTRLRPPDLPQQGKGIGLLEPPDGPRLPPGGATGRPARGPAWRRLSVLIPAVAVALAIPIVVVLIGSGKPSASQNTGNTTSTGTTGASSVPTLAVPAIAETIPVGHSPNYIQVAPNGQFAYIANPGAGAITVLDTANDQVSGTIPIPQGPPQAVSFSPDGQTAYVSVYNTRGSVHLIAFIDTATRTVTGTVTVNNHEPGPPAASPDGPFLYVPNHNMAMGGPGDNVIDVINTQSKLLVDSISVPANPHWIAFSKNGQLIYATNHMSAKLTVLNPRTNTIVKVITVGETPHSEVLSPDGSHLAITSYSGNEVFLFNTATDQVVATIPVGREPLDIAYSPDGRYLFAVNNLSNTVTVIDTADNVVIANLPTGKGPTSISVLPNGRQAYVTDETDGTIEVLNIPQ
jgi:YVTN family beta-propeller protein